VETILRLRETIYLLMSFSFRVSYGILMDNLPSESTFAG